MKLSDIESSFYYEKSNAPGWLRFIVSIDKHQVLYADFIDYAQCRLESFGRWANRRYSAKKAAERFPKEVADIGKVLEHGVGSVTGGAGVRPSDGGYP